MNLTKLFGHVGNNTKLKWMSVMMFFLVSIFSLGLQAQTIADLGKQSVAELESEIQGEMIDLQGETPADRRDAILQVYKHGLDRFLDSRIEFKDAFNLIRSGGMQTGPANAANGQELYADLDMTIQDLEEYGSLLDEMDLQKGDISDIQMLFDYFRELLNR